MDAKDYSRPWSKPLFKKEKTTGGQDGHVEQARYTCATLCHNAVRMVTTRVLPRVMAFTDTPETHQRQRSTRGPTS